MKLKSKIIILVFNILFCIGAILETVFLMHGWGVFVKIVCYGVASAGIAVGVVVFILDKQALLKTCFILTAFAFAVITIISVLSAAANLNAYPSDADKIERLTEIIRGTGEWGMVVYVLIQILQVTVLPLPAVVCYIPGSQIWGALTATLLASAGVIIGSMIAYAVGRVFGKRAAEWIAGKEAVEKYSSFIGNKGKVIFLLMQILPFFPDDILCIIAGLTAMSFPFFAATIILVRPLIIAMYCYLGTGNIIPFSGWGIPVWIAIFAVCIVLAILSLKYQDKIEKWLVSRFRKKDKNKEEEKQENKSGDC